MTRGIPLHEDGAALAFSSTPEVTRQAGFPSRCAASCAALGGCTGRGLTFSDSQASTTTVQRWHVDQPLAFHQPLLRIQVMGYDGKWLFAHPALGAASCGAMDISGSVALLQ